MSNYWDGQVAVGKPEFVKQFEREQFGCKERLVCESDGRLEGSDTITPGVYKCWYSSSKETYVLASDTLRSDPVVSLNSNIEEVLVEIQQFVKAESAYAKLGAAHKRGVLMYGPPGNGKSSTYLKIIRGVIDSGGYAVANTDVGSVGGAISLIRKVSNAPIAALLEDIDVILHDHHDKGYLLNLLDGVSECKGVIFLASTNYPELLEENVLNRPGRFDRRIFVGNPTLDERVKYFLSVLEDKGQATKWAEDTDGLSIAHLKELALSVIALKLGYEATLGKLKALGTLPKNGSHDPKAKSGFGFGA